MGDVLGDTARVRLTLWACLNYKFSPFQIHTTSQTFKDWLVAQNISDADAIAHGRFYDFAHALGCIHGDFDQSKHGWDFFEPGTMGVLSLVVFSNLLGKYTTDLDGANPMMNPGLVVQNVDSPHHGQPVKDVFYPRPMVFERIFGDREEIVIRSTKYGIKITLQSLPWAAADQRKETRSQHGTEEGFTPQ